MPERTFKLLAPVVAFLAAALSVFLPAPLFGHRATQWNPLRRWLFPLIDNLKEHHDGVYSMYSLDEGEHAGTSSFAPEHLGVALANDGYSRMPLSALKHDPDGDRIEAASWAKRTSLFAPYQTHVMLFDREDGGSDVYAHYERSAYSPRYAYEHYRGIGQDYEKGVQFARDDLDGLLG